LSDRLSNLCLVKNSVFSFFVFSFFGENNMNKYNTLLVIDDTPNNIKILLNFLTKAGFEVLVARDGQDGITTAEYAHPDLILLDIMMPGLDGFEVCQRLKSSACCHDIPIIFMTAKSDTVDKITGFNLGAADYITKPFQHEEVLARIHNHLTLHQQQLKIKEQNQILADQTLQLKELTLKLHERNSELEQRNQELDAFAHTVAHDLKNPLNGILGLSELLLTTYPYDNTRQSIKLKERLEFIHLAGKQTVNIIEALLLLAGVSRQQQVEFDWLDMSDIVNKVIQERLTGANNFEQGQIEIPETWPVVRSYAPWVEEIWANYLSNGLKYGGKPPRLQLGATEKNEGMVRFWVRDNGPGLSESEQRQLFTPFIRLHKKRAEGHGLGLSIVRQIVEKLGGKAGVESVLGGGSTFYFTLPIEMNRD
jgi:two-component system sensor histidine kinase/response regulator